jgi:hypothetical protein
MPLRADIEADHVRVWPAISGNQACLKQPMKPESVTQPNHNNPMALLEPLALLASYE